MKYIKCILCKQSWLVEDIDLEKQKVCPYCGETICGMAEFQVYDSLDKALYGAILKMGKETLKNPRKLFGFMLDTAPELQKEIKIFMKSVTDEGMEFMVEAFDPEESTAQAAINKFRLFLIQEEGLSDHWANILCHGVSGARLYTKSQNKFKNVEISEYIFMKNNEEIRDYKAEEQKYDKMLRLDFDLYRLRYKFDGDEIAFKKCCEIAEQGYVPAYNFLGEIYYQKKDYQQALYWYLRSAERNDGIGQYYIGLFYQKGLCMQKDPFRAIEYYDKAAHRGIEKAIMQLAYCYRNGIGCKEDLHKAFEYYKSAADMGNKEAMYTLDTFFFEGEVDLVEEVPL